MKEFPVAAVLEGLAWYSWFRGQGFLGLALHVLAAVTVRERWRAALVLAMPGLGLLALVVRPSEGEGTAVEDLRAYTRPTFKELVVSTETYAAQVRALEQTEATVSAEALDAGGARSLAESVPEAGDAYKVRRLMALMADPAQDTYHVAAARLARLQEHFAVQIFKHRTSPPEVLGEVYVGYLRSGLLEGVLADFYYKLAVQCFEAAAAASPDSYVWPLRVAELHRRNGRYREALEVSLSVLERFPGQMDARMRILEIYYYGAQRGVAEATRHFLDMLERLRSEMDPTGVQDAYLREAAEWWFPRG